MPTRHHQHKVHVSQTEGETDIAEYFVPAVAIRDFMPVELRPCRDGLLARWARRRHQRPLDLLCSSNWIDRRTISHGYALGVCRPPKSNTNFIILSRELHFLDPTCTIID